MPANWSRTPMLPAGRAHSASRTNCPDRNECRLDGRGVARFGSAAGFHRAQNSAAAAARQVNIIVEAAFGLAQFPQSGRAGRRVGTRELIVGRTPYLVPYRVRGDSIEILRVLHGRQL